MYSLTICLTPRIIRVSDPVTVKGVTPMPHKYELYDIYETEVYDCGELICASDDYEEISSRQKNA